MTTLLRTEIDAADRLLAVYGGLFNGAMDRGSSSYVAQLRLAEIERIESDLRVRYDLLRIALSRKYNMSFPTVEETRRQSHAGEGEKKPTKGDQTFRTWTSRAGGFQIKAKLRGLADDGKAVLEKTDGGVVRVRIESLSEADRQFIDKAFAPQGATK